MSSIHSIDKFKFVFWYIFKDKTTVLKFWFSKKITKFESIFNLDVMFS